MEDNMTPLAIVGLVAIVALFVMFGSPSVQSTGQAYNSGLEGAFIVDNGEVEVVKIVRPTVPVRECNAACDAEWRVCIDACDSNQCAFDCHEAYRDCRDACELA